MRFYAILARAARLTRRRERLVKISHANTAAPSGKPRYTGWCLDPEDLCIAKLCALREKDQNSVAALLDAGLVDSDVITARTAAPARLGRQLYRAPTQVCYGACRGHRP
jgi:hypothetical protein